MNHLFIFLAISKTLSLVIIILLLVAAAVIGYLTAWLYARSVYTPVIKELEDERDELNKQVRVLKDDITILEKEKQKLEKESNGLKEKLSDIEKEIAKLKEKK